MKGHSRPSFGDVKAKDPCHIISIGSFGFWLLDLTLFPSCFFFIYKE